MPVAQPELGHNFQEIHQDVLGKLRDELVPLRVRVEIYSASYKLYHHGSRETSWGAILVQEFEQVRSWDPRFNRVCLNEYLKNRLVVRGVHDFIAVDICLDQHCKNTISFDLVRMASELVQVDVHLLPVQPLSVEFDVGGGVVGEIDLVGVGLLFGPFGFHSILKELRSPAEDALMDLHSVAAVTNG